MVKRFYNPIMQVMFCFSSPERLLTDDVIKMVSL